MNAEAVVKLKLRLKFHNSRSLVEIKFHGDKEPTVSDLLSSASATFNLPSTGLKVGLNANDLFGADEDVGLLSTLGLVTGDLIYVTSDAVSSHHLQATPPSSASLLNAPLESINVVSHINIQMEPYFIHESKDNCLPISLHQLVAQQCPKDTFDVLSLVLHMLMVECGYVNCEDALIQHTEQELLSPSFRWQLRLSRDSWRPVCGNIVILRYIIARSVAHVSKSLVNLRLHHVGGHVNVHCSAPHFGLSTFWHVDLGQNVGITPLRDNIRLLRPKQLSRDFKNIVCERLKIKIVEAQGGIALGLQWFPDEVKLRLLRQCDAQTVCRLGSTCRAWRAVAHDNFIWRKLFVQNFRNSKNATAVHYMKLVASDRDEVNWQVAFRTVLELDRKHLKSSPPHGEHFGAPFNSHFDLTRQHIYGPDEFWPPYLGAIDYRVPILKPPWL